ncbi:MAG: UDP-N-acetylglucosamine 1-carboxyvinyltransferase [Clostridiales bacterium]|nr:UDP-N-acetylglucosamine 1-carboxyvinyltransferase [Clostridiales bacterium]MDY5513990.1 UDP-N-acetylglucosamine 1-carboxyvinyltransferase [Candidatus Ventricola sp.]
MAHYAVRESPPLRGEIPISTSKNAVLPIMCGALLTDGDVRILQPPGLTDVTTLCSLLAACGCRVRRERGALILTAGALHSPQDEEDVRKMRASVLVLGPLLARLGEARIPLPGGCAIGQRPIDQHIKGMSALGAKVVFDHGGVTLTGRLRGAVIYLDMPSVGATENLMMAATLAEGTTRIENAAKEPEIVDLAAFLGSMGAKIAGAGTSTVTVEGVASLHGTSWQPIADRIEAGTMACACAITGGELLLRGARAEHLRSLLFKLSEAGVHIQDTPGGLMVFGRAKQPFEIRTMVYPGFPTDLQAPMMAVACKTPGTSVFLETIFENRFMHAAELARLGAHIRVENRVAVVEGTRQLTGAPVRATDLRAGAALILAGLCAEGETLVDDEGGHIDRGYCHIEEKLSQVGGDVRRVEKPT